MTGQGAGEHLGDELRVACQVLREGVVLLVHGLLVKVEGKRRERGKAADEAVQPVRPERGVVQALVLAGEAEG